MRYFGLFLILLLPTVINFAQEDQSTIWQPEPMTTWQWQLSGDINISYDVTMYDIDLFDTSQELIEQLHDDGRIVICYFSAGSYEDWRPDADKFPETIFGNDYDGWEGEIWLDIRKLDLIQPIMLARLELAVEKDCDGVEPDNIASYDTDTGFDISIDEQITYNIWLAETAHELGLSIGLKNGAEMVEDLLAYYDWALVEECFFYDFCEDFVPFIDAGKAVFVAEYTENGMSPDEYCEDALELQFSTLTKMLDLDDLPPNDCITYLEE